MARLLYTVVAVAALTACAQEPPIAVDAGADAGDAGPCGRACGAGQACCASGLAMACLTLTTTGECPLPDLTIDGPRAGATARLVWSYFAEADCALVEGCVEAAGWRRLLRFETFTPNVGTGDMDLGVPSAASPNFVYSPCHDHYHFEGYADYRLDTLAGAMAADGHKQAFCLLDSERVLDEPSVATTPHFTCFDQGISRGWGDEYYAGLDCQWIDVTDVAPGDYALHISINGERALAELSYDNNVADVPITITDPALPVDPLAACPTTIDGPRDCGWSVTTSFDCAAGASLEVGCGTACGVGTCVPDVMLRVCAGDAACTSREALAFADEGCGIRFAGRCPLATVVCPAAGRITVMTAPYLVGDATAMCTPGVR